MQSQLPQLPELRGLGSRAAAVWIASGTLVVLGFLALVLYGHPIHAAPEWMAYLPALNASLNAVSASFLILAYRAVRRRALYDHVRYVLRALVASSFFLISYITYHSVHGDTHFSGHGPVRAIYFFVLITHVTLSAAVVPLILTSLFLSLSGRYRTHKRLSRVTLPVWLYVSVTGVLVFVLLAACR